MTLKRAVEWRTNAHAYTKHLHARRYARVTKVGIIYNIEHTCAGGTTVRLYGDVALARKMPLPAATVASIAARAAVTKERFMVLSHVR